MKELSFDEKQQRKCIFIFLSSFFFYLFETNYWYWMGLDELIILVRVHKPYPGKAQNMY